MKTRKKNDTQAWHMAWPKALWLWGMLLPSVGLGWWALSLERVMVCGAFGLVTLCLGHSVGLHRGEIHGAFQTSGTFRALLLWCASLTGVGGPLSMIRVHHQRDYWQNQSEAPAYFGYDHDILTDFFLNLHTTCDAQMPWPSAWEAQQRDRVLGRLERVWRAQQVALGGALWVGLGWEWAVVGVCMRVSAGILGHWGINFVTHKRGSKRYAIPGALEEGHNQLVLGWISFGEGFHNNHHAYPGSAKMGHGKGELDLGWAVILASEKLGLMWEVKAHGRQQSGKNPLSVELPIRARGQASGQATAA